jgi:hypothetical protein
MAATVHRLAHVDVCGRLCQKVGSDSEGRGHTCNTHADLQIRGRYSTHTQKPLGIFTINTSDAVSCQDRLRPATQMDSCSDLLNAGRRQGLRPWRRGAPQGNQVKTPHFECLWAHPRWLASSRHGTRDRRRWRRGWHDVFECRRH